MYTSLGLGVAVPLGIHNQDDGFVTGTMFPGGIGYLDIGGHLDINNTLGVRLGGIITGIVNEKILYMAQLGINYKHFAYLNESWWLTAEAGAGANVALYINNTKVDPYMNAAAKLFYKYDSSWAFGGGVEYMAIPQIYMEGGDVSASHSTWLHMLNISLSFVYHPN